MPLPGSRLRALAAAVFNVNTMTHVIDPAVADLQADGGSVRSYLALLKVIAVCTAGGGMHASASETSEDRAAIWRVLALSTAFIAILTVLQEWPLVGYYPKILLHPSPLRFVYLAPQALAVTLTAGMTLGLIWTVIGRRLSRRVVAALLMLSLAASVVSFVNLGWIRPRALQAFGALWSSPRDLVPDAGEMTLGDLAGRLRDLRSDPLLAHNGYTSALAFSYHTRWALGASPLVFTVFVLSLGVWTRRRWLVTLVVVAFWWGYYYLLNLLLPWNSGLPTVAAAWSANVCLLAIAATAVVSARMRSRVSLAA